jgi:hypothetical protein
MPHLYSSANARSTTILWQDISDSPCAGLAWP